MKERACKNREVEREDKWSLFGSLLRENLDFNTCIYIIKLVAVRGKFTFSIQITKQNSVLSDLFPLKKCLAASKLLVFFHYTFKPTSCKAIQLFIHILLFNKSPLCIFHTQTRLCRRPAIHSLNNERGCFRGS